MTKSINKAMEENAELRRINRQLKEKLTVLESELAELHNKCEMQHESMLHQ